MTDNTTEPGLAPLQPDRLKGEKTMKVKTFLNKMMMSSSVNVVRIEQFGYTKIEYDEADLRLSDYGEWGNETVKTFVIHNNVLVINV